MPSSLDRFPAFTEFLKGLRDSSTRWLALGITEQELLDICEGEELYGLVHHRLSQSPYAGEWPVMIQDVISRVARREAAEELLHAVEVRAVLDTLAAAGIPVVLLKGTALAYTVYPLPACRPRSDTDLLVLPEDVSAARAVLASLDYRATVYCDDLFSQFEMQKVDKYGVLHVFDFHWKISTQPAFADVLTCHELLDRAQPVPALGVHAIAAGPLDALLLACIHPVMHHRNDERVLWTYDIHLLASRLTETEWERFSSLASDKKIAAVSAERLRLAQKRFNTRVCPEVIRQLSAACDERSAEYLGQNRRWHHELISSVKGVTTWRDRLRLMRKVLFPDGSYMLAAYGLIGKPFGRLWLPILYIHRNVRGAWKIVAGHK
jgi:hypothetical protein